MLKGKMNHKDTLGYSTTVEESGVQIMSSGQGLRHEEYNIGEGDVNFLQVWIQPKQQNIIPRYQQRNFSLSNNKNKLTTIVSGEEGLEHCWINQNAKLSLSKFDKFEAVTYHFNPINKCLFIFIITGSVTIGENTLVSRDAIGIWDTGSINIDCTEETSFLIIETPVNQK